MLMFREGVWICPVCVSRNDSTSCSTCGYSTTGGKLYWRIATIAERNSIFKDQDIVCSHCWDDWCRELVNSRRGDLIRVTDVEDIDKFGIGARCAYCKRLVGE